MQQCQHLRFPFFGLRSLLVQLLFQDLLNPVAILRMKQLPQNFSFFHRTGKQKFPKLSLRDHYDLTKLFAVHTGQFFDLIRDCLRAGTNNVFGSVV